MTGSHLRRRRHRGRCVARIGDDPVPPVRRCRRRWFGNALGVDDLCCPAATATTTSSPTMPALTAAIVTRRQPDERGCRRAAAVVGRLPVVRAGRTRPEAADGQSAPAAEPAGRRRLAAVLASRQWVGSFSRGGIPSSTGAEIGSTEPRRCGLFRGSLKLSRGRIARM